VQSPADKEEYRRACIYLKNGLVVVVVLMVNEIQVEKRQTWLLAGPLHSIRQIPKATGRTPCRLPVTMMLMQRKIKAGQARIVKQWAGLGSIDHTN
jgi:hypothetical protein